MTSPQTETIPTLTTVFEAVVTLETLANDHDWVSVFWDRGWGDHGEKAEITVIVDGDGQKPHAHITRDVYRALVDQKLIAANSYGGYKARRLHDYKTPPAPEKTGPTSNDIAEIVIRKLMHDLADQPIRTEFYRGLTKGPRARVKYETVDTPAMDGTWFVLLLPGHSDVAMSAQEPGFLGPEIIGVMADRLDYPRDSDGQVDINALGGGAFRAQLEAAVREKLAVIATARKQS
jgi:hypothetical protein